jgi:cobalt/nickel transport system permease protein/cobalt/nickel transport protein
MSTGTTPPRVGTRRLVVVGILVCLFLAGVVSFYASSHPDGLESVARKVGFGGSSTVHDGTRSPFAGYATRGVDDARLSGGIAGVVGAGVVLVLAGGLFLALRRRDPRDQPAPDPTDGDR